MNARDRSDSAFRDDVLAAGLLVPSSVDGVYGRSETYENVAYGIERYVTRLGEHEVEGRLDFPPVLPRSAFERTGYLSSFPHLMGSIHSFAGDEGLHTDMVAQAHAGEKWAANLEPTDVMLCSAACHSLYPGLAGYLPPGGQAVQVTGWCFRREPSLRVTRMQAFRMVERVYVGEQDTAVVMRDRWLEQGRESLIAVGLDVDTVPANDPFFGRSGRLLAQSQRETGLKFELVFSFSGDEEPVALASSNLHQDHFGEAFGISTAAGTLAHSTCFGWGVDRIVLALLCRYGTNPDRWPLAVRGVLWP